ncbi:MutS protein msh5 [Apophysomyces sp. BC1015]|nr:MutS protein msh5 [Apophysomyces sp. BC1015]KAG0179809.1 MutS protein msh5 [Apophysomyces sp. BC1021]
MLKQWISQPTLDIQILQERHASIQFFIRSDGETMVQELRKHLKQIRNIPRLISKVREHQVTANEWQQLLQFAYYGIRIGEMLQQCSHLDLPILHKAERIVELSTLKKIGSDINNMIDFDQSSMEDRTIIKKRVDQELDILKEKYEGLDDFLLEVAQEIGSEMRLDIAATLNVVYFPQLGFFLTLPQSLGGAALESVQYFFNFELQFTTAEYVYFKNKRTKDLDEEIGDIHVLIVDKEIELVQTLAERTLTYKTILLEMADVFAELDWHPLYELSMDAFIPNDTYLVGGQGINVGETMCSASETERVTDNVPSEPRPNSIMLLSGANFSGKSVYLKQVALITYMSHTGSFVPASKAVIGLTDRMFAHTHTMDTASMVQSTFAFDLQQLLHAVNYATEKSMVIVDEFGKANFIGKEKKEQSNKCNG